MKKEITLHPVKRNGLESLVIELALIKQNIYIDNTDFLFRSMPVTFLGLKIAHFLKKHFFRHLVILTNIHTDISFQKKKLYTQR